MEALTDSSVIIAMERGQLSLSELGSIADAPLVLSAISVSELLHGVHRADAKHRMRRAAFVEMILEDAITLAFDTRVARVHAHLSAALARSGTPIGAHDLQIGSTAVAHGLKVVTRKPRDFVRIPGCEVVTI
ncbi:MAG: PIN domain-containing protein [Deltaproteobacteria bacterium]|nr:PIN domain-containing protein [Deltaproteobacteria bacterium]